MHYSSLVRRLAPVALLSALSISAPVALPNGPRLVLKNNFPDPAFIEDNGVFYAFSTTNGNANVPIARSTDFETWEMTPFDAMADMPAWSTGSFWAPHVTKVVGSLCVDVHAAYANVTKAENRYVLYFSGGSKEDGSKHCVGAATSDKVTGPFTPEAAPLACPLQ